MPLIQLGRPLPNRGVERRRTVIEDPRGEARFAAESIITRSFLQGALFSCSAIAAWAVLGSTLRQRSSWQVVVAGVLAVAFAAAAKRAGSSVSRAARKLKATRQEATAAETAACREAHRDLWVTRIAGTLSPAYAVWGIVNLQSAPASSVGLLLAAVLFGFAGFSFAYRAAERVGNARHDTRSVS